MVFLCDCLVVLRLLGLCKIVTVVLCLVANVLLSSRVFWKVTVVTRVDSSALAGDCLRSVFLFIH